MKKQITSTILLVAFIAFGLTATSDADAGSARNERVTSEQIQACVDEIGRHADYGDASRVVHRITTLDQRNFWEMEISVETLVYLEDESNISREYATSCITVTTGSLLRFRIDALQSE